MTQRFATTELRPPIDVANQLTLASHDVTRQLALGTKAICAARSAPPRRMQPRKHGRVSFQLQSLFYRN